MNDKIYISPFLEEMIDENDLEIYDVVLGDKRTRKAARKKRVKREIERRRKLINQ